MNLPKFIITMDGYFRLGMVNQHKHLLKSGDQCIGGGYYHFDFVSNRILLDSEIRMAIELELTVTLNDDAQSSHSISDTLLSDVDTIALFDFTHHEGTLDRG